MLLIGKDRRRHLSGAESPPAGSPAARLIALALLGSVLGAGGTMLAASLVLAGDDAGIRSFHLEEAARRQAGRPATPLAYAPARTLWSQPLFASRPDERLAHPAPAAAPVHIAANGSARRGARHDTVSAASGVGRTICVRLCDGFHAPIGNLRSQADFAAHEALCAAQNPGVPVKVFRVPGGSASIDGAVSRDGRTYGSLPVAYGHEKSADASCRPPIVQAGERRVSLLRDFTLRPGDTVVLDGRAVTFNGSADFPYRLSDFSDFRSATVLSVGQRRLIDAQVGISRGEEQALMLHRSMRLREPGRERTALAGVLRGSLAAGSDEGAAIRRIGLP